MKNNLIFIGMPSSGKSTLGRLLAKELDRPFLYAIIDTENGLPIFIGVCENIK